MMRNNHQRVNVKREVVLVKKRCCPGPSQDCRLDQVYTLRPLNDLMIYLNLNKVMSRGLGLNTVEH